MMRSEISTPDSTSQEAGTRSTGPAFGVPNADPLTPLERYLLAENRKLKRECGRLWLKAFTPADRQEYLLARLDRVAELIAADERGELDDYYERVIETFNRSLDDTRQPVEAYVLPRAA
jgi:hypothetical protein